ncbi:MAG: AAA family ATPase, partial [Clostridia bacterium]|nr:AAA family ATPase [Clostridia bacterium]
ENYLYVDKTKYIYELEKNKKLLYVRPRRFGKSLLTSMLSNYYDINEKENFERLFKGLEIYKKPTKDKNNYYVLNFNFSGISVQNERNLKELEEKFILVVQSGIKEFIKKYKFDIEIKENLDAANLLRYVMDEFKGLEKDNKIYILIDEYDHFANGILQGDAEEFKTILGNSGFVRAFYEVIKEYTGYGTIDRFYATGVMPLMLDSLTSGFNIAINISTNKRFVNMVGFSKEEVKNILDIFKIKNDKEDIYEVLEKNYDGYRFSVESEEKSFNSTLVIYYLNEYINEGNVPTNLIDMNLSASYEKIKNIVDLKNMNGQNYDLIEELVLTGKITGTLKDRLEITTDWDTNDFISLLFFNGYITIKEGGRQLEFRIPNSVSRSLYAEYLSKVKDLNGKIKIDVGEIQDAITDFGVNGNIEPVVKCVKDYLVLQSVRDKENFSEKELKFVFSLLLGFAREYNVYTEFPAEQGFADMYIEKVLGTYVKYNAIVELKYLTKKVAKKEKKEELVEQAKVQLKRYLKDKRLTK